MAYLVVWEPMEANHYDFLAVFNEAILCVSCYLMFLFTDYVPMPEDRYQFGYLFLYVLYINLGINLLLLGFEISRMVHKNLKRYFLHRKLKKDKTEKAKLKEINNLIVPI